MTWFVVTSLVYLISNSLNVWWRSGPIPEPFTIVSHEFCIICPKMLQSAIIRHDSHSLCKSLVRKKLLLFSGNWDWEGWRGLGFNLIYHQSGVMWKKMLRSGHGWRLGQVPDVNPQHSSRPNGVLRSCLLQSVCLCMCVRACVYVCIFTLLLYQLIFPLCARAWGAGSPRALGLR